LGQLIDRDELEGFLQSTRRRLSEEKDKKDFFTRDLMLLNFEQYVHLQPAKDPIHAAGGCYCWECVNWDESTGWCEEHSSFVDEEGRKCHPWESDEWRMFEAADFCSYGIRKKGGI